MLPEVTVRRTVHKDGPFFYLVKDSRLNFREDKKKSKEKFIL